MALFREEIITEIVTQLAQHHQQLGQALGQVDIQSFPPDAPIVTALQLLVRIANGELSRGGASNATVAQAEEALALLHALFFGTALGVTAPITADFWARDIGVLYSRARWWLSGDELITISNAAALAFGENNQANRMRIVRAIDSGLLDAFPDPSVANPQQNRRLLRPQVERLGEQRRRPGT